jgi:hypothetical protein
LPSAGFPPRYQEERFVPFVVTGLTRTFFRMTGVQLTAVPGWNAGDKCPAGEASPLPPEE